MSSAINVCGREEASRMRRKSEFEVLSQVYRECHSSADPIVEHVAVSQTSRQALLQANDTCTTRLFEHHAHLVAMMFVDGFFMSRLAKMMETSEDETDDDVTEVQLRNRSARCCQRVLLSSLCTLAVCGALQEPGRTSTSSQRRRNVSRLLPVAVVQALAT